MFPANHLVEHDVARSLPDTRIGMVRATYEAHYPPQDVSLNVGNIVKVWDHPEADYAAFILVEQARISCALTSAPVRPELASEFNRTRSDRGTLPVRRRQNFPQE